MKLIKLLMVGGLICLMFAGQSMAEVLNKLQSDGLQAEADWSDTLDRYRGRFSMQKTTAYGGTYYVYYHIMTKDYYGWKYLTSGGGYVPEDTVKGTIEGQLRVEFDSAEIPPDQFWTRDDAPVIVDLTFTKDGNSFSKTVGSTTTRNGDRIYKSHGIKISSSANVEGSIAGHPVLSSAIGSVGENQGMSISIEKADPTEN